MMMKRIGKEWIIVVSRREREQMEQQVIKIKSVKRRRGNKIEKSENEREIIDKRGKWI